MTVCPEDGEEYDAHDYRTKTLSEHPPRVESSDGGLPSTPDELASVFVQVLDRIVSRGVRESGEI